MSPSSTIGQDVNPLRVARLQTVMMYRYLATGGEYLKDGRPARASKTCNLHLAQRLSCHLMLIPRKPCEVCAN